LHNPVFVGGDQRFSIGREGKGINAMGKIRQGLFEFFCFYVPKPNGVITAAARKNCTIG